MIPHHTCQSLGTKPSSCLWLTSPQKRRGKEHLRLIPCASLCTQDGRGLYCLQPPSQLRGEEQELCIPAGPVIPHCPGCSWHMGCQGIPSWLTRAEIWRLCTSTRLGWGLTTLLAVAPWLELLYLLCLCMQNKAFCLAWKHGQNKGPDVLRKP